MYLFARRVLSNQNPRTQHRTMHELCVVFKTIDNFEAFVWNCYSLTFLWRLTSQYAHQVLPIFSELSFRGLGLKIKASARFRRSLAA